MYVNWVDTRILASKLTAKRLINLAIVTISYLFSRITRTQSALGMPISISIEPTTACNLRCPECPSGLRNFTRPTGKMTPGLFKKIVNEVATTTSYLTFYFQGEPFLHPGFLEMVGIAESHNIYTATSTNAHFLTDNQAKKTVESGLSRLIISIDGTTQSTYEHYRIGGDLTKVLEGTKNVIKWREELHSKTPTVIWQFLVVRPNEHQIDELKALAKAYQVDKVALKTAQIYDYKYGNELIPTKNKYSRYQEVAPGQYRIKNKLLDHCWKMWSSCVVTWDGEVVPCCFDKDASHPMGTLHDQSLASIWQDTAYQVFRKRLLSGRDQIEMCKNCSEGTSIWA
jgi:radical SAM protein with 4Fe4S-binding SPASM domain